MAITVPSMQEMLEAGVHFGHKVSRGNPKAKRYIFGARDGIQIIDLEKSEAKLKEAAEFANKLGREGKLLLVVGTKKQAREIVNEATKDQEIPYLSARWVGGLLTNFDEIRKTFRKLNDLRKEQIAGTLSRYTKKEQLLIGRKVEKFVRELGGVAELSKVPDALFILDIVSDITAVKEATRLKLPMIGLADTNSNPDLVDYPIPANDDGIKSIKLLAETIINAYTEGRKGHRADVAKAAEEKEAEDAKKVAADAAAKKEAAEKVVVAKA